MTTSSDRNIKSGSLYSEGEPIATIVPIKLFRGSVSSARATFFKRKRLTDEDVSSRTHTTTNGRSRCAPETVLAEKTTLELWSSEEMLKSRLESMFPEQDSKSLNERERLVDSIWFPLFLNFKFVGLSFSTILLTRSFLFQAYLSGGVEVMASTISGWQKAVRVILADEPHTRSVVRRDVGFSPNLRNSRYRETIMTLCRLNKIEWKAIVEYQGERPMPPFLLDHKCLRGLTELPSYEDKAVLVALSNFKRTLPPPGKDAVREALSDFKQHVENDLDFKFDFTEVSRKFACIPESHKKFPKVHVSNWKFSNHSSLDYSRGMGGKTQNIIDDIVNEFLQMPIKNFFPTRPEGNLLDVTGTVVITPSDWDDSTLLTDGLYRHMLVDPIDSTDCRFGQIGLLWAIYHLRQSENVNLINVDDEYFFTGTSYKIPKFRLDSLSSVSCKVTALPEQGWKVRVITMTSMAVSIIGEVARHVLDHLIWSDPAVKKGLLERVKLYSIIEHIGGKGAAMWSGDPSRAKQNITPPRCESIDLTCATDCPDRGAVRGILNGIILGIRHPHESFLKLAVDLALCDRQFIPSNVGDIVPVTHRCGIMMGEALTGIFLNWNSSLCRACAPHLLIEFPELRLETGPMSNHDADLFISENHERLQTFLNSVILEPDRFGTNCGDDVVTFSVENRTNALRVFYRMSGMVPSENTWYSSTTYSTFTEETAIRTFDSKGWKFVDCVKPRVFQIRGPDPSGSGLASKIGLLTSFLKYEKPDSPRILMAIEIADMLISRDFGWSNAIKKGDMPIGLPSMLGGINHPCCLLPNYILTLSESDIKVIQGLSEISPLEALALIWEVPEDDDVNGDMTSQLIGDLTHVLMDSPVSMDLEDTHSQFDIKTLVPEISGEKWFDLSNRRKKFLQDHGLISIVDFVNSYIEGGRQKLILESESCPTKVVKSYRSLRNKSIFLRQRFHNVEINNESLSELSVWRIKENVMNKSREIVFNKVFLESLADKDKLPSLMVHMSSAFGEEV